MIVDRLASEGPGFQSVTDLGFEPQALWFHCFERGATTTRASWGLADDDSEEDGLNSPGPSSSVVFGNMPGRVADIDDGNNSLGANLKTRDPLGFTLEWEMSGAGIDVRCIVLGLR